MSEWSEGNFQIISNEVRRSVAGLVSGEFGIYFDEHRNHPGWVMTHIGTGLSIAGWQPFDSVDIAKAFVARVRPLAESGGFRP